MNEQVMMWLAPASNRPAIAEPMLKYVESGQFIGGGYNNHKVGGEWMLHNYAKIQDFMGNVTAQTADELLRLVGDALPASNATLGGRAADGLYHVLGCASPEYKCFAPFDSEPARNPHCKIEQDCNYALSQIRWGLEMVQRLINEYGATSATATQQAWWAELDESLVFYPNNSRTGFMLSYNCSFLCPHRHFSHLLEIFDLETTQIGHSPALDQLIYQSIDQFYGVTCIYLSGPFSGKPCQSQYCCVTHFRRLSFISYLFHNMTKLANSSHSSAPENVRVGDEYVLAGQATTRTGLTKSVEVSPSVV